MKARLLAPENRKWWTLVAVSFGLFMIRLDNTVVNVALPSIQKALKVDRSELEWVVVAYALTFPTRRKLIFKRVYRREQPTNLSCGCPL